MKLFYYFIFIFIISIAYSQNLDESILFGDTNVVEKAPELKENPTEMERVGLSGRIGSALAYSFSKDYLEKNVGSESNIFSYGIDGDLFFDVRLQKGYKIFSDLWIATTYNGSPVYKNLYNPVTTSNEILIETNEVTLKIKEIFLDYNLSHIAYFRIGKQFLKWGTTYFWNPVDIINREKKSFTDLEATREGVWGIKLHIPYKTIFNFYSFVDFTEVQKVENSALATKLEFVLGNTEFGLYGWFKKEFYSVYGADISTRLLDIDIKAEGSISYGDNRNYLKEEISTFNIMGNNVTITNYTTEKITNEWVYRLSLNLYKGFEFLNVKDRITTMVEFFYNSHGYTENIFDSELKRNFAIYNGLYVPNEYGKFYTLFMLGYKDLFISDLSLSINYLVNWTDYSSRLSVGFSYAPVDNVTTSLTTYANFGEEPREYTYTKLPLGITAGVEMRF
ncbi:MAG: hypothetical protein N2258_06890 [Brevinematales bacterium]|nr:hypothetical protein [Brevinematales bacterium]